MLLEKLEAVSRLIGNTPVVGLDVGPGKVYVKLEYMNPTGSHKDRIAYYMLREAVSRGLLKESDKVVEASSGNTAISVSWVCNLLGLKPVIFTEDTVSRGKLALLRGLGAEIHLVPRRPYGDPEHYINVARRFAEENGLVFLNQYDNEANWRAHYETTGPEIRRQVESFDAFVMGVGTGGTIVGVGKYLRENVPGVRIIGVAPSGSPLLGGSLGDNIEGLASTLVSGIFSRYGSVVDELVGVSLEEAISGVRELMFRGILAGPSSGANLYVATRYAMRGLRVVTLAADSILRYPEVIEKL
jgi:cysteine synthase